MRRITPMGEEIERVRIGEGRSGREGAAEDAADDAAQDQRLAGETRKRAAEHRGEEDVGQVTEEDRIGHHRASP